MKLALPIALCALSLLASRTASADALPAQPGLPSSGASARAAPPPTMEPAGAALLFAGLAGIGTLVARRRCIVARLAGPVRSS